MRAFLALSLPTEAQRILSALQAPLRHAQCRVAWVREGNFHCTLRFLGEIDDRQRETLGTTLRNTLAPFAPLEVRLDRPGAFPNSRRPAVLWIGLETLKGNLAGIQSACENAAQIAGLPRERKPFHPHITLGRVRDTRNLVPLAAALVALEIPAVDAIPIPAVSLYQSTLKPSGPEYRLIVEFPLACPSSPPT